MSAITWNKYPSVRPGGKPYFWHCFVNESRMASVVWNRQLNTYVLEVNGIDYGVQENLRKAKRLIENALAKLGY